jgi:uncharacterized damage-inducible protein DinB
VNWYAAQIIDNTNRKSFEEVIDLLRSAPDRLGVLLEKNSDSNSRKSINGHWTGNEHAGHLLTMESLWIARLDDFAGGNPKLRQWNGHNRDTVAADYNRSRIQKIIEEIEAIRLPHTKMLEKFKGNESLMKAWHPELSREVNLLEHLNLVWLHDLHHIGAIGNLLTSSINS